MLHIVYICSTIVFEKINADDNDEEKSRRTLLRYQWKTCQSCEVGNTR